MTRNDNHAHLLVIHGDIVNQYLNLMTTTDFVFEKNVQFYSFFIEKEGVETLNQSIEFDISKSDSTALADCYSFVNEHHPDINITMSVKSMNEHHGTVTIKKEMKT